MNILFPKISRFPKIKTFMIILTICSIYLIYSNGKQNTISKLTEKKANQVTPVKISLQKKMQTKENEETVLDFEAKVSKKEKSDNKSYMENLFKERLEHLNIACSLFKNHKILSLKRHFYNYFFFKYDIAICLIPKVM